MSERALNPAEIQQDHAVVHFFALLAGVEDIEGQARLLVSGIAFFLRMDAVVLGFEDAGTNTWRLHTWHAGAAGEFQVTVEEQDSIEARVVRAVAEIGAPAARLLPLIHLGRILGHLAVARRAPELVPDEEFLLASLQTLTALLLANYTERKQAEALINRRNRTLAGINSIFREALNCETEEALGRACLRVAEEITGSQFGFIGELGSDGLLHDLAVSDLGWEACSLVDKSGHRRPPGNFKIRGLYGRVLQSGRSMLTNTPAEHPDAVGTPPGHPRLTAFLGVPLVDGSRTLGMIALGNRPGGYRQEELESLEALAPAIVEALHRKRTEQALIRSEKLVSVGRLAATIAHEINNPLEGATNALYLVGQDESLSPQGRVLAGIAEQELRRAAQIARRTLGFYREPNARAAVRISEVISDLVALYEPRLRGKAVEIRVRCAEEGVAVVGNSGEMRQLFSNLLANSLDAVGESGIVHIRVARQGAGVRISVADTGTGIERSHLKRIFEPFFTTKKDVGTGLGLWITEQIVKKHGGSICVRSRVGKGTVFSVILPSAASSPYRTAAAGQ